MHVRIPFYSNTIFFLTIFFSFLFIIGKPNTSQAQSNSRLKVFLNCRSCDRTYILSEVDYVDYARDQALSDLQIFINRMGNASGGSTYEIEFTGYGKFEGIKHQLTYLTEPNTTRDRVRRGMVKRIEAGLVLFLVQTPVADEMKIVVPKKARVERSKEEESDMWNKWVFKLYGDGGFDKEASRSRTDLEFGLRADRITEEWRINTTVEFNHFKSKFQVDEDEVISVRDRNYAYTRVVKSISNHWSVGTFANVRQDSYRNIDLSLSFTPAIEYSLFPYSEVTRREITASYRVGYVYNDYIEGTIFEKSIEHLMRQTLSLNARFTQPWGNIYASVAGSSYLHDFTKKSLDMNGYISVRVFKGLSARLSANLEIIRDQLNLPRQDASIEDILLKQRQLATDFEMGTSIGLSYTFGSTFNNIINTRL